MIRKREQPEPNEITDPPSPPRVPSVEQKHDHKQNHKQRDEQPKPGKTAFTDLKIAYLACQKSAEGVQQHASSQREGKAWYHTIESILRMIQVSEEDDNNWCSRNRE
jgi:hypothetical protein